MRTEYVWIYGSTLIVYPFGLNTAAGWNFIWIGFEFLGEL